MKENKLNKLLEKLKIDTFSATLLGLITLGGYWLFYLKKWLIKNQEYKEAFYNTEYTGTNCIGLIQNLEKRTGRNLKLIKIISVMLILGLFIFFIEMYAELVARKILFDEEPFWFYVWLNFSLFAVLLGSIAFQIRKSYLEEDELFKRECQRPWLFDGGGKRIYVLTILNIILALGLLPFIVFPPILGSALNEYVHGELNKAGISTKN